MTLCVAAHPTKHRVLQGSWYIFEFEDYSVKLMGGLPRINTNGFANPIPVLTADLRGLMYVTMESQVWLVPFDKIPYSSAANPAAVKQSVQMSVERRRMHDINGFTIIRNLRQFLQFRLNGLGAHEVPVCVNYGDFSMLTEARSAALALNHIFLQISPLTVLNGERCGWNMTVANHGIGITQIMLLEVK